MRSAPAPSQQPDDSFHFGQKFVELVGTAGCIIAPFAAGLFLSHQLNGNFGLNETDRFGPNVSLLKSDVLHAFNALVTYSGILGGIAAYAKKRAFAPRLKPSVLLGVALYAGGGGVLGFCAGNVVTNHVLLPMLKSPAQEQKQEQPQEQKSEQQNRAPLRYIEEGEDNEPLYACLRKPQKLQHG